MRVFWTILAATLAMAAPSAAQTFPDHPIRIIVPQPPGGGFDLVARIVADRLPALLGQPVIVENRPGAGTVVGTDVASKAAPDGYTMLLGGTSNMALNLGLYPKLSYDPVKDFKAVGLVVSWPFVLVARKDLPQQTFKDVLAYAKANPGKLTYASAGRGTGQHISAAVSFQLAGIDVLHVPYSGAQPAYQDILGGRVDLFFDNASTAMGQIKGEAVRPLAVSSAGRYSVLPNLPTVKEAAGVDFDIETWFGLFVPAATPAPVLEKLRGALAKVVADPAVIETFAKTGGTMSSRNAVESEAYARAEAAKWSKLVREAGVTAE
jgi:tripartite-type tricarboxylate transporter receptor subunit TctC